MRLSPSLHLLCSQALMGVNYVDFLSEAHRVLRSDGILKIAEVG